jgi:formylglycine-generating enzyme required for sulfatase activity
VKFDFSNFVSNGFSASFVSSKLCLMVFWLAASFSLELFVARPAVAQQAKAAANEKTSPTVAQSKAGAPEAAKKPLGIVAQKPATGPSVKIDGGYMVPYTSVIPGTEIRFQMVPIPGGTFTMGSPEDEEGRNDDEGPQFQVTVEPFWAGKYEVTWDEYQSYMEMDATFKKLAKQKTRAMLESFSVDAVTAPSELYDPDFTYYAGEEYDQPAATMSQFAAKQYTKWLSLLSGDFYRLPYEAEWEYACRAGTKTAFNFGDDVDSLDDHGWYVDNSDDMRQKAGEKKPNAFGLFDMHGNVAEWVLDAYDEKGYSHLKAGKMYTVEQTYKKPTKVYSRVLRGGSWELDGVQCRSAARLVSSEDWKNEDPNQPKSPWWFTDSPGTSSGFRLVRPLKAPKTLVARNEFWKPDVETIAFNAAARIESNGRGAMGKVDKKLAEEMKALRAEED